MMNFWSFTANAVLTLTVAACAAPTEGRRSAVDVPAPAPRESALEGAPAIPESAPELGGDQDWYVWTEPTDKWDRFPSDPFEPVVKVEPVSPRREAHLTLSPPQVAGAIDAKQVEVYLRRYLSGIKWCYVDRLQTNPALEGEATSSFAVLADGTTSEASVKQTLGDAELERCFLAKIGHWRFPQPTSGTAKITVTFGMQSELIPAEP